MRDKGRERGIKIIDRFYKVWFCQRFLHFLSPCIPLCLFGGVEEGWRKAWGKYGGMERSRNGVRERERQGTLVREKGRFYKVSMERMFSLPVSLRSKVGRC